MSARTPAKGAGAGDSASLTCGVSQGASRRIQAGQGNAHHVEVEALGRGQGGEGAPSEILLRSRGGQPAGAGRAAVRHRRKRKPVPRPNLACAMMTDGMADCGITDCMHRTNYVRVQIIYLYIIDTIQVQITASL